MQIAGNALDKSALAATRAQEYQQQAGFRANAEGDVNASLDQSTPAAAQQQQQAGTANRLSMYQALKSAGAPLTAPTETATGNSIVGGSPSSRAANVAGGASTAWQNLAASAQAREGGQSDWENQQAVKNAVTMGKLGTIGTQASDAASIYPVEQQVAMQRGDPLNGWGQLLSTLGGLSMMGAAVMPATAAAVPTAAQMGALNAGLGPVNAAYAATLPANLAPVSATTAWGNLAAGWPSGNNYY
jgi:hypothetical protein